MFVKNKRIGGAWEKVDEVSTGETFTIQPLFSDVFYCVSVNAPDKSVTGGIIPKREQLMFTKVGGDLYLKDADGLGHTLINIDIVEA